MVPPLFAATAATVRHYRLPPLPVCGHCSHFRWDFLGLRFIIYISLRLQQFLNCIAIWVLLRPLVHGVFRSVQMFRLDQWLTSSRIFQSLSVLDVISTFLNQLCSGLVWINNFSHMNSWPWIMVDHKTTNSMSRVQYFLSDILQCQDLNLHFLWSLNEAESGLSFVQSRLCFRAPNAELWLLLW